MTNIALMFIALSQAYNLPPGLLSAVCFVESSHRPTVVHVDDGGGDSVGLCQVKLGTARFLGFKGQPSALKNPNVNALLASKYLAYQLDRYDGNTIKAISAYNMGSFKLNAAGVIANKSYVLKVLKALKERR